ncbi:MAG: LysE family translocator [Deltaproteobacteria bacterium]|nr:LysE family translocator [Deltaproteobacteria bacterium]
MDSELTILLSGVIFGLSAGISPGPLLILVITETLNYGMKEGIKVACAPLITDLPIILISTLIFSSLSHFKPIVGLISLCGAFFIGYLGYESITTKGATSTAGSVKPQSLRKGIITNFLNPHPYLFWLTIGAPTVMNALNINVFSALLFLVGFYVFVVGSKIMVAATVNKSRFFTESTIYICTVKILGILLLLFSVKFLLDGLNYLGML